MSLTITWPNGVKRTVQYLNTRSLIDNVNALTPVQGITVTAGFGLVITDTQAYIYIKTSSPGLPRDGNGRVTLSFTQSMRWIVMSTKSVVTTIASLNIGDGLISAEPVVVSNVTSDL